MNAEYAPGTVVTATVNGRPNVRLVSGWSRYDPQLRWCELSPRWGDGDDEECWHFPSQVSDVRPLVVIDPEDREEVERLAEAIRNSGFSRGAVSRPKEFAAAQAVLRSLIAPPKPAEPTGLGAVVEDADGVRWVRMTDHEGANWHRWNAPDDIRPWRFYVDIAAVRILTPGVDA